MAGFGATGWGGWIPAVAGMTDGFAGRTEGAAGRFGTGFGRPARDGRKSGFLSTGSGQALGGPRNDGPGGAYRRVRAGLGGAKAGMAGRTGATEGGGAAWWGTRARGSRLPLKGSRDPRARDVAIFWAAGWRDAEAGARVPKGRARWGGVVVRLGPSPTAARLTTNGRGAGSGSGRGGAQVGTGRSGRWALGLRVAGFTRIVYDIQRRVARGGEQWLVVGGQWLAKRALGMGRGWGIEGRGFRDEGEAAPGTAGAGTASDASNASSACIAGSASNAGRSSG